MGQKTVADNQLSNIHLRLIIFGGVPISEWNEGWGKKLLRLNKHYFAIETYYIRFFK